MNAQTKNAVANVISDFRNRNLLFTAHDVTTAVRSLGHRVGHDDVRNEVVALYDAGDIAGYDRAIAYLPGGFSPFVYKNSADDVSDYDQDWIRTNPSLTRPAPSSIPNVPVNVTGLFTTQPVVRAPTPAGVPTSSVTTQGNFQRTPHRRTSRNQAFVTKDARIQIPIEIVSMIAAANEIVKISKEKDSAGKNRVVLSKANGAVSEFAAVNVDGRIRLGKQYVNYLGSSSFRIKVEDKVSCKEIVVESE